MNNIVFLRKIFAFCGILAAIATLIVMTILGLIKPNYDPLIQTMSELGEEGGPNAYLATIFFIVNGILLALFSISLFWFMKEHELSTVGPIILIFYSFFEWICSGIFPCDQDCAGQTFTGAMHIVISVIGLSLFFLLPLIIWYTVRNEADWQDINKVLLIFGIIIFILAGILTYAFFKDILLGLIQRIYYVFVLGWVSLLSIKLLMLLGE